MSRLAWHRVLVVGGAIALLEALGVGIASGAVLHRFHALRDTLDPLFATYYAVPVFAFYPFFIVVFGLGDMPQVLIAFMLGVVAVIVNTLNGTRSTAWTARRRCCSRPRGS